MRHSKFAIVFLCLVAGCASIPNGPSVAVMPAPGKPFDQFIIEDNVCRQFAQNSIGTSASQAATDSEMKSIAAGTAIGVVAGILGAGNRNGGGVGAAFGMLEGGQSERAKRIIVSVNISAGMILLMSNVCMPKATSFRKAPTINLK